MDWTIWVWLASYFISWGLIAWVAWRDQKKYDRKIR